MVALNLDDEWLVPRAKELPKAITYVLDGGTLRGKYDDKAARLTVNGMSFACPLPGAHNARNLLAAVAVCTGLGLSEAEIEKGLETFQPPYGRSQLVDVAGGPKVLCDYYNASPSSMRAGLDTLSGLIKASNGSSWACLADMLELGPNELRYHAELAEPVKQSGVKNVLLFGERMKSLESSLKAAGFSGKLAHYSDIEKLIADLTSGARAGDVALIKGSRSMRMERVFQAFGNAKKAGV